MKLSHMIAGVLLAFFLISGLYYATTNSITSDEPTHITAGYLNLRFNDYRFNVEHPPLVKQLAALPLLFLKLNFPLDIYHSSTKPDDIVNIQNAFLFHSGNNIDIILLLARIPNILIALLLGILIYLYSKRLNGPWAGVISLCLFTLSPSFLGHSPLVTMDTAIACFYFAAIYFLAKFFETRSNLYLVSTGIFLGLALISKFSALILIPIIYALLIIYAFTSEAEGLKKFRKYLLLLPLLPLACSYKDSFKIMAPALFAFIFFSIFFKKSVVSKKGRYAAALLLIVLTIAFTFIIIDYTDFKWLPFHSATKAYFKGFSSFQGHAAAGQGYSYLLGQYYKNAGRWYYFPLAILFKEPFVFPILFLAGLFVLLFKKSSRMTKICLLLPLAGYLFVSMFVNKVNIGIRHILPAYPFMYVIAGYCIDLIRRSRYMLYLAVIFLAVLAFDVLSMYPAHLSYFSRIIGGIDNGYKFLGDSNVAWGQDSKRLDEYLRSESMNGKRIKIIFSGESKKLSDKEKIAPEKTCYIIEATELCSGDIKWADKIRPTSRIGGSLFVYDITDKERGISVTK